MHPLAPTGKLWEQADACPRSCEPFSPSWGHPNWCGSFFFGATMISLESNDLTGLIEKFADSSVLKALNQKSISLDHVQLLAVLSKEKQNQAISAILALDNTLGVDELRQSIEAKALRLDTLPAQKNAESACISCIHNTTVSSKVFPIHVAPGLCTNGGCDLVKASGPAGEKRNRQSTNDKTADNTKAISEIREKLWRSGLKMFVLQADRGLNRVLFLCMLAGGWKPTSDFGESIFKCKVDPVRALEIASSMDDPATLSEGLHEVAANLVDEAPIDQVRGLLKALHVPLGRYFPMQKRFLDYLDLDGIYLIAKDLGVEEGKEIKRARETGLKEYAKAVANAIPDDRLKDYVPPDLRP